MEKAESERECTTTNVDPRTRVIAVEVEKGAWENQLYLQILHWV